MGLIRRFSTLVAFPLLAAAQQPPARGTAGVFGTAVDSIHHVPLAGAVISLTGTDRKAITDAAGRFRLDSVTPGQHELTFAHPVLDTLGIGVIPIAIRVDEDHYTAVVLAIPSPATVRRLLCPSGTNAGLPGGGFGRVRDARTGGPAAGAVVTLAYVEFRLSADSGFQVSPRERRATVGADGSYAICGLPADVREIGR